MAQTPEGKVKAAVQAELKRHSIVPFSDICSGRAADGTYIGFYYMPVAGRFSVLGIHDFVGCARGRFFTIETKAPDNPEDATVHQEKFRQATTDTGGISFTGVRDASVVSALIAAIEQQEVEHAHQA